MKKPEVESGVVTKKKRWIENPNDPRSPTYAYLVSPLAFGYAVLVVRGIVSGVLSDIPLSIVRNLWWIPLLIMGGSLPVMDRMLYLRGKIESTGDGLFHQPLAILGLSLSLFLIFINYSLIMPAILLIPVTLGAMSHRCAVHFGRWFLAASIFSGITLESVMRLSPILGG